MMMERLQAFLKAADRALCGVVQGSCLHGAPKRLVKRVRYFSKLTSEVSLGREVA